MEKTLTEKQVLRKLGISDFRHMTKDKIVKFVSVLPYMDPEVAKAALEQFPAFKELACAAVGEYKLALERVLSENSSSQDCFYSTCSAIINSLQRELQKENLSAGEREHIEERMIEVAKMVAEKDSENKKFLVNTIMIVSIAISGIVGIAAAILGSNTNIDDNYRGAA